MPKRARSYLGPPVVIISMAQQASPKVAGHSELLRKYPASFSTEVSRKPLGSFSSIPMLPLSVRRGSPRQSALAGPRSVIWPCRQSHSRPPRRQT